MKRLRSYGDDLDTVGRDRDRDRSRDRDRERDLDRSSSHRRFHSTKPAENGRDDRESSRSSSRKRIDYDFDGFDRRKSSDRYGGGERISSPRNVYGGGERERIHRSESFSGTRREFPKGYISERERERERSRREESVSSWRRLSGCKDVESRVLLEDRVNVRSPQASREVLRSPQSSREVLRSPQSSREVLKSPQSSRDVMKSPPGSKDSWSEHSKCSEVKRRDEVKVESSNSSEMEEGELEPEPELESSVRPVCEDKVPSNESTKSWDCKLDEQIKMATDLLDESKVLPEKKVELNTEGFSDGKEEDETMKTVTVVMKGVDELQQCHENPVNGTNGIKETAALDDRSEDKKEDIGENYEYSLSPDHTAEDQGGKEEMKDENAEKSLGLNEESKEENDIHLEVKNDEINFIDYVEHPMEETRKTEKTLTLMTDTLNGKDKGKSVAVSPSRETTSREISKLVEKDLLACRDDAMEGPSSRGFELFSTSSVTKPEKTNHSIVSNDGKLKSEPLELSLGLPNVLLPLPSHEPKSAPSSPSRAMSVQSLPNTFRTSSDGFSGSMSFSGSQTHIHNPSCSLTQNSFENYEQSVGSHPLFQGIDQQVSRITWPGQSLNEPMRVESANCQRLLYGNGSHPTQPSQGIVYTQAIQRQQRFKLSEGSSGISVGQDRPSNLHRQLSGLQSKNHIEARSPTNSVGSRETRSELSKVKKHTEKERNGSLYRSSSQRDMDQLVIGGIGFAERIITMIVSEPVQVMARRMEEMGKPSLTFLKESSCEIIVNKDKRWQLHAFQEALQKRSDLTVEILSKSHRAQLEILVAFKTGLREFLQRAERISSSDLAEIYHNLRCRNLACLSLLPVDECDCKVCVQKNGFCSACMCLICSKFDMALNTCSWVGCDVCLHWCHTVCGLRKSYIRNGSTMGEAQETTEMQFHCVACNHPSEMFGFVKEVFKTCAKEWKGETLSKELEYVQRIFSASNDPRGKQLHIIADQMIARLKIESNLSEVHNHIMEFLTVAEGDAESGNTPTTSLKEISHKNSGNDSNGVAGPSQVAMWLASASTENILSRDSASTAPPKMVWDQTGVLSGNPELQISLEKMPVVDELESIIRIKLAEAKMFQARADEARKEAEGLNRIAVAKNEKNDAEYSSRITKLRLADAEERRKQKLNEVKVMEREHREFFSMKLRMESDIRVLLSKMEATKQNYST